MDTKQLHDIVERQRRIYGEAFDRVIRELHNRSLVDLADYVQAIKVLYGMGDFKSPLIVPTLVKGELRVRPYIDEETAKIEILTFLRSNRPMRFKSNDIRLNINGRLVEHKWSKVKNELVAEKKIKQAGKGTARYYWVD